MSHTNQLADELSFLAGAVLDTPEPKWRIAGNLLYKFGENVGALYREGGTRYALLSKLPEDERAMIEALGYQVSTGDYVEFGIGFFEHVRDARFMVEDGQLIGKELASLLTGALASLHEPESDVIFPHRELAQLLLSGDIEWTRGYGVLYELGILTERYVAVRYHRGKVPTPKDRAKYAEGSDAFINHWYVHTDMEHAIWTKLNGEVELIVDLEKLYQPFRKA